MIPFKLIQTLLSLFIVLIFFTADFAQAFTPNPAVAAKVDEYMNAAVKFKRFSGAILVAQNGQLIYSNGFGMANYELDVPNRSQTIFRLGSITKVLTATAIMMLQERGKLNVKEPICKYLSDCPAEWQPITIRHLLTHTSGITDYLSLPGYEKTLALPVTETEMVERFRKMPLEFAPGEKFKYSSSGYYLLGIIIERASGKTYEEFLGENIFKPLGMLDTGYDTNSRVVKKRAAGYMAQGDGLVNAPYVDMSVPFAAGGLYSTVDDLFRFDNALYTEKLLSRKSLDEMYTPFRDDRGYGWGVRKRFDRQVIEHDGIINGFFTTFSRYPSDRVTVIVLSNNGSFATRPIADDLSAIVFGAPYKIPQERKAIAVDAKTLEKYVGQYQPPQGSVITVTLENGKLMRQIGQQPKVELFAESETEFFMKGNDVQIKFATDAQGNVTGQLIRRAGRETLAQKIK